MSTAPVPGIPTRNPNHGKSMVGILRKECSFGEGGYYVRGDWMHLPVNEEGHRKGQRDIPLDDKGNPKPVEVSLNLQQAKANIHKFDNREEIAEFFGLDEVIHPMARRTNAMTSIMEKKRAARKIELQEEAQILAAAVSVAVVEALRAVGIVPPADAEKPAKPEKGKKAAKPEAAAEAPSRRAS
jgi:hypothetical protein